MALPRSQTAVSAGSDESTDAEVWAAFDQVIAQKVMVNIDHDVKTMRELMAHYGKSRNVIRRWLKHALREGLVERVTTYREVGDTVRPVPGYKVKQKK